MVMGGLISPSVFCDHDPAIATAVIKSLRADDHHYTVIWDQLHLENHLQEHCKDKPEMYKLIKAAQKTYYQDKASKFLNSMIGTYFKQDNGSRYALF